MRSLLLLLAVPAALAAQRVTPTTRPVPRAIARITEADLRRDLFALAADSMRGREGGTTDEMRASMWIAEQYRRIGLEPGGADGSWFQWFDVIRTRVSTPNSRAALAGRWLTLWEDLVPLGVVPTEAAGNVLWIDDPTDTSVSVAGRVVATELRAPAPGTIRPTGYPYNIRYTTAAIATTSARLTRRGATAVLLVASADLDSMVTRMGIMRARGTYDVDRATPRTANGSDRIGPMPALGAGGTPVFLVRAAHGPVLRLGAPVELSVRLERFSTLSVNVIGKLRGTDPVLRDEYVLYSSHQDADGVRHLVTGDSVMAGADDNGSVTVAELAAARAFVAQRPRRSLLFVNHGAEERGLLGSRVHSAHPVVPIERIVAVLNGDMIGRNHPDTAAVLGTQPPHRVSSELAAMAMRANDFVGKFVVDTLWDRPTHPEGWFFRSDHLPYVRRNVPALMWSTNLHEDYHTANDVPELIDYAKLTRMARWMYLTGWFVANAPVRPAVDAGFKLER